MNTNSRSRKIKLRILGLLAPSVVITIWVVVARIFKGPGSSDWDVLMMLMLAIIFGAGILSLGAFDRFWKVHLYACLATYLPIIIALLYGYLRYGLGPGGLYIFYIVLYAGMFMFIFCAVATLPINGVIYAVLRFVRSRHAYP